ncbi:MAG: carbohydrate porin, partial [Candidatus Kryptoniota bacterium]
IDQNKYANDPTTEFMNWVLVNNGAWDFAADTRGYTWGLAAEYIKYSIHIRIITALEPESANGLKMDVDLRNSLGSNLEFEFPYSANALKGVVRVMIYLNRARMGNYDMSIKNRINGTPDIISTRQNGRTKLGLCLNFQQPIDDDIGVFSRIGWSDGQNETWAFTEVDRFLSGGVSVSGSSWHNREDHAGLAFAINMLSKSHREYLEAGGAGFMLGDGKLNYAPEFISELYYNAALISNRFQISPDYQLIINPAYNKDRGPVSVFSVRLHIEI